jgi:hypothetical protein
MSVRGFLKSPLIHFFVLGGLIFAAYSAIDDSAPAPPADTILLTSEEAKRLSNQFAATWGRAPTAEELSGLMRSWVLEEAYVREAEALGLDRGDPVVRQRLRLKMEVLAEAGAAAQSPAEADLQDFLDNNKERFERPALMAFDQVLLPAETEDSRVEGLLTALNGGAEPPGFASARLLPPSIPLTQAPVIDRTFGGGFHDTLAALPVGSWQGPVESGYGRHLVRITETSGAVMPDLQEIRKAVEAEWRTQKAREKLEAFSEALLERYTVTMPPAQEVLEEQ